LEESDVNACILKLLPHKLCDHKLFHSPFILKQIIVYKLYSSKLLLVKNKNCSTLTCYQHILTEQNQTLEMVRAGLHCSLRISRQMLPLLLMLGWKTLVLNATWKECKKKHHYPSGKKRAHTQPNKTKPFYLTTYASQNLKLLHWQQNKLPLEAWKDNQEGNGWLLETPHLHMDYQQVPLLLLASETYLQLQDLYIQSKLRIYQPQIWTIPDKTNHPLQKSSSRVGFKPQPSTVKFT